jgi:hypothetical protein
MTAAASVQDAERQMNELAQLGFDFVQMSASGERIYVVMEDTGGNAGTVELEALQAGIPSQGPTAERQFSESELASGRR